MTFMSGLATAKGSRLKPSPLRGEGWEGVKLQIQNASP
jgi:hypothetical protein